MCSYCNNVYNTIAVCTYVRIIQWNLSIKDTLGPAYFVHCREVVHSSEVENVLAQEGHRKVYFDASVSVLCREVISIVSFIWSVRCMCTVCLT